MGFRGVRRGCVTWRKVALRKCVCVTLGWVLSLERFWWLVWLDNLSKVRLRDVGLQHLINTRQLWRHLEIFVHGFGHFYLLWFLIGQWSQSNRFLSTLRFQGFCKSFSLITLLPLLSPIYWIIMHIECSCKWICPWNYYSDGGLWIMRPVGVVGHVGGWGRNWQD